MTQLQVVGEHAGVPVYAPEKGVQSDGGDSVSAPGETSGDPVKVARDSIALAKQKLYDTVIIDTAGRLGVDEALMQQARDIRDAVNPNEILFVIDAMIGQDAVQTAKRSTRAWISPAWCCPSSTATPAAVRRCRWRA